LAFQVQHRRGFPSRAGDETSLVGKGIPGAGSPAEKQSATRKDDDLVKDLRSKFPFVPIGSGDQAGESLRAVAAVCRGPKRTSIAKGRIQG
jgi:hypothetical protein